MEQIRRAYKTTKYAVLEIIALLVILVGTLILLPGFAQAFSNLPILDLCVPYIVKFKEFLVEVSWWIAMVILIQVVIIMISQRYKSFNEYYQSIKETYQLRRSSLQTIKSISTQDGQQIKQQDPTIWAYNKAIKQFYVDISSTTVTAWLKVPGTLQGQEILKQNLPIIEEKIRTDNPAFTFSQVERNGNYYIIEGTMIE